MDKKQASDSSICNLQEQTLNILDYWHKIEFFESTDIRELEDDVSSVLRYTIQDLVDPYCLPWIQSNQLSKVLKDYSPRKNYKYKLYFGIFDRSEIFQHAEEIYPQHVDNYDEKTQNQGRTCSITVTVSSKGNIDSTNFEFSTVTWALGKLQENLLNEISINSYEQATANLLAKFLEIISVADELKQQHQLPSFLTTFEIIEFLKHMEKWTCFSPETPAPALYIKVLEDLSKDTYPNGLKPNSDLNALPLLRNLPEILSKQGKFNVPSKQSKRSQDNAEEITILNSFYIRDIERVIKDIKISGLNHQSSIGCYLSGNVEKKEDLLTPVGENKIIQMLRLNKMPLGRWPSDNTHAMSLMQQFAINAIEETLTHCGLYSVNGPPGTGKTTMLRDLIANNLVKRA